LASNTPVARPKFTQLTDTVTESITGSSADLAIILTGPDPAQLRDPARHALAVIRAVPGSEDAALEQGADQSQLRGRIDRPKAPPTASMSKKYQDLVERALGGRAISILSDGERRFDIAARLPYSGTDVIHLRNLLVRSSDRTRVPLADLADVGVVSGASIIARRENERPITVRTNIRGREQRSLVHDAQRPFASKVQLPQAYQVECGGQFENLERARKRLMIVLPMAIALIVALLFFAFGAGAEAGLVLMNVPVLLVGGFLLLWIRGINLSVSAAVGFISLFGVVVMSGVLLVAEIARQRRDLGLDLRQAAIAGSIHQVRPVLVMIIAALLGMIPAVRAVGIGSHVQRPLVTVVVGGLTSTLVVTLAALPSLYYIIERRRRRAGSATTTPTPGE
jgi:heavy metal efflux system protein